MGKAMKVGNKEKFWRKRQRYASLLAGIGLYGICTLSAICSGGCGGSGEEEAYGREIRERVGGEGRIEYVEGEEDNGELDYNEGTDSSRQIAEAYRDIYEKAAKEGSLGSLQTIQDIVDRLGEKGYCALDRENENQVNLTNPEKIEEFCRLAKAGKEGEAVIFSVMEDGGFIRFDLEAAQGELFVTRSVLQWKGGMPEVDYVHRFPASEWEFSGNGYFFFRESVPQGYDGAQGYTAIRVHPLEETFREYNRKYILPIGYDANQVFLLDWTEEDFGALDFDDLFAKLYAHTYGKPLPYEQTIEGKSYLVSEEEYEKVILSYFRMDKETLRAYGNYRETDRAYEYRSRGFYDCASSPNNPYPEVVSLEKGEGGIWKLRVNAVWPIENLDKAFSHEVTIRVLEDGGFQYVSNKVIPDEDNVEPIWYTEKIHDK